ncbi:5'-3' exoribonuclease 2 [Porphyridium purpureum]|uniref:5'-3' exoribonuclease 2 n=1 Tax=Porphyridium purpureum TaxID=35688 RepID=A0A5J4Z7H5_PORPP|nr:5'-3' exoribonuclease 2 [Porphyridium purpureum]|eukprot:POR5753..scf295_1
MGIPAFFRWLSMRYPKILVECVEEVVVDADGGEIPIDASAANPNGVEFDALYLDMNGIIHPCTHPEDRPAPTTEEEMFEEVMRYVDRLMRIVRPRKMVYMAIDGVAPRAKINQQRSRRFRAAQEAELEVAEQGKLRKEWKKKGLLVDTGEAAEKRFDSNVITPGTPFMDRLAVTLRRHVDYKVSSDPAWANLHIVLSDASVPGEGEHKIAEFIRQQRLQSGYDASTKHVMYGLDADLIMLGLATHEAHFTILREFVDFNKKGHGNRMQSDVDRSQRKGAAAAGPPQFTNVRLPDGSTRSVIKGTLAELGLGRKPFQFLHIRVLREYLFLEFKDPIVEAAAAVDAQFRFDFERVVDDFVFMCFFVGNDFLPHLPSLEIREGAIDFLIEAYKDTVPTHGYLTDGMGEPNLDTARLLLREIGEMEFEVFRQRVANEKRMQEQQAARSSPNVSARMAKSDSGKHESQPYGMAMPAAQMTESSQHTLATPSPSVQEPEADPQAKLEGEREAEPDPPFAAHALMMQLGHGTNPLEDEGVALGRANDVLGERRKKVKLGQKRSAALSNASATLRGSLVKNEIAGSDTQEHIQKKPKAENSPHVKASENARHEDIKVEGDENGVALTAGASERQRGVAVEKSVADEDEKAGEAARSVALEATNAGNVEETSTSGQGEGPVTSDTTSDEDSDRSVGLTKVSAGDLLKFKDDVKSRVKDMQIVAPHEDKVRLHDEGWKLRYYREKLRWDISDASFKKMKDDFAKAYFEGLVWVMRYYYRGCVSWEWYYAYHYAPFASDLAECSVTSEDMVFEHGRIFTPLEQLMSVLPAASADGVLPPAYKELMDHSSSPIIDFYPVDFEIDMEGKRFAWQGVALLPFIDEVRLRQALEPRKKYLTEEEIHRNTFGEALIATNACTSLGQHIQRLSLGAAAEKISQEESNGIMFGLVSHDARSFSDVVSGTVFAIFRLHASKPHLCHLLPTAPTLTATLDVEDKVEMASGRLGWKVAKMGPLGIASKRLIYARNAPPARRFGNRTGPSIRNNSNLASGQQPPQPQQLQAAGTRGRGVGNGRGKITASSPAGGQGRGGKIVSPPQQQQQQYQWATPPGAAANIGVGSALSQGNSGTLYATPGWAPHYGLGQQPAAGPKLHAYFLMSVPGLVSPAARQNHSRMQFEGASAMGMRRSIGGGGASAGTIPGLSSTANVVFQLNAPAPHSHNPSVAPRRGGGR